MTRVVFSKDRPLQLDAFLRSYAAMVAEAAPIYVLCQATTERQRAAYMQVFDRHAALVEPIPGDDLKADLLGVLPTSGSVVFFVDDIVFTWPVERIWNVSGFSLRLGLNLTRCYTVDRAQPLPDRISTSGDYAAWVWADGAYDWRYPMSVDGHVLDLHEVRPVAASATFATPTMFETALARQVDDAALARRSGTCYQQSRLVNIPWNRVQDENQASRHAWRAELSPQRMLEHWEGGQQVALDGIYGLVNESCHQELPLALEVRP